MCNCRIAKLCHSDYLDPGMHIDLSDKIENCPLCGVSNKWSFHGPSDDAAGCTVECCQCNNYIRYYFSLKDLDDLEYAYLDKEEFYFEKYCLIKEDNMMILLNDLICVCEIPVFAFKDQEHLLKKIKTYIPFL